MSARVSLLLPVHLQCFHHYCQYICNAFTTTASMFQGSTTTASTSGRVPLLLPVHLQWFYDYCQYICKGSIHYYCQYTCNTSIYYCQYMCPGSITTASTSVRVLLPLPVHLQYFYLLLPVHPPLLLLTTPLSEVYHSGFFNTCRLDQAHS